jgi:hypothetical protein
MIKQASDVILWDKTAQVGGENAEPEGRGRGGDAGGGGGKAGGWQGAQAAAAAKELVFM